MLETTATVAYPNVSPLFAKTKKPGDKMVAAVDMVGMQKHVEAFVSESKKQSTKKALSTLESDTAAAAKPQIETTPTSISTVSINPSLLSNIKESHNKMVDLGAEKVVANNVERKHPSAEVASKLEAMTDAQPRLETISTQTTPSAPHSSFHISKRNKPPVAGIVDMVGAGKVETIDMEKKHRSTREFHLLLAFLFLP